MAHELGAAAGGSKSQRKRVEVCDGGNERANAAASHEKRMKAGVIFITTCGSDDDRIIQGAWRARKDFDFDQAVDDFVGGGKPRGFDVEEFTEHLMTAGLAERIEVPEYWLGDYGEIPTDLETLDPRVTEKTPTWVRGCHVHEDCRAHPELSAACAVKTKLEGEG